jgi:hypothetical protein
MPASHSLAVDQAGSPVKKLIPCIRDNCTGIFFMGLMTEKLYGRLPNWMEKR